MKTLSAPVPPKPNIKPEQKLNLYQQMLEDLEKTYQYYVESITYHQDSLENLKNAKQSTELELQTCRSSITQLEKKLKSITTTATKAQSKTDKKKTSKTKPAPARNKKPPTASKTKLVQKKSTPKTKAIKSTKKFSLLSSAKIQKQSSIANYIINFAKKSKNAFTITDLYKDTFAEELNSTQRKKALASFRSTTNYLVKNKKLQRTSRGRYKTTKE